MKNPEIRQLWEQFIEKYSRYFISNEDQWQITLEEVSRYIDENDKRPSTNDKDKTIKHLGQWISHQQTKYRKQEFVMKNPNIRQIWEEFIEKYSVYFS